MSPITEDQKYRMSFSTGGLFLNESVAIARMYQELGDWTEVKKAAGEQGVAPFRNHASVTRTIREIVNRLSALTEAEISVLCTADRHEQQSILWLALCRGYPFIGEFARELLYERYLSFRTQLTYDDFDAYFAKKAEWSQDLAEISSSTHDKLRQILFRMMREVGILNQDDHICHASLSPRITGLVIESDPQELRYFPGLSLLPEAAT